MPKEPVVIWMSRERHAVLIEFGSVIRALFIHFQHRVLHRSTLAYGFSELGVASFIA